MECVRVVDFVTRRQVSNNSHSKLARELDIPSFCVSAKNGDNVNAMFVRVAADLSGVELTKAEVDAVSVRWCMAMRPFPVVALMLRVARVVSFGGAVSLQWCTL